MLSRAGSIGVRLLACVLVALGVFAAAATHAAILDITSAFALTRSGFLISRTTNTFDQSVTLKNTSGRPIAAPIVVVVNGLPSNVALANKAGQTPDGRPYVSPPVPGGALANGATLSFALKFSDPQRVAITSTLQVLNGIDLPLDAPSLMAVVATGGTNAFVIGRVVGASNLPITLQATTAATCIAGSLAGGSAAGGPIAVTTDAGGYFGVSVSGVTPGAFVAVNVVSPTLTATSACLVSSRDNDSWPKAFPLDGSPASAQDLIDAPGKTRWYKFSVLPGQSIEVKLSGLPADYDLAVFKDIAQAFAKQFTPGTGTTSDLLKLTAEYAPSVFSPSVFSPSVFSPSVFSPSVFSPSVFSPSVFSPSVFSPSVFSPSVFSPSVFSPSVFSPSVFSSQELAQAFSTAQTRSVISVAATPGTSDESTVANTWNNTGNFYVRVSGHNGAFDTSTPFTVSITKGATTCANVTDTAISARARLPASALETVIVTDSSKLALDAPLTVAGGTLRDKLAAFAARSEIAGVVVDVSADARVRALKAQAAKNPACPFAKNLVAEEIKSIVDAYRANPLRYVVIAGNDDTIPFFRLPDESGLGQESGYVPPVESNSSSEASLRLDFVLSQDGFGSTTSLSLRTSDFPIPSLAVGRLIESPDEIASILDAYVAAGGTVVPKSSLVTGYDFLADAASAVRDELQQGTGAAPDALITPNGKSPQDPASWTAAQLGQHLFGARHDVIFLAGHFSANSALAADFATSLLTTDLAASTTDFTNSIVFSAGCHSGYNLVDADAIAGVTQPLDWAQAFARKGATLVAGTGYQYGDTDFLEYSERLYDNFARQLRAGSGAIAVGEALVKAKLDYLAITPDIRGLHEKALLEATLFGLPMLGVDMPAGRGAAGGTSPVITAAAVSTGPAVALGLKSFDLTLAPALSSSSVTLKNAQGGPDVVATWLSGPDGVVTKPGEPALPLVAANVTPTDPKIVLRGVGLRGGTFADVSPMFPFSGAPTTELRGVHFPFVSPTFYPARLFTVNYFGALAGSGGTQLLVTPAQHRVASVADGTSTERSYKSLTLRLYYSGNLTQAALSDAPSIVGVDANPDGAGIAFTAQVVGDPAAGIQQVWVTYTSDATAAWTSLDLLQCVAPLPVECAGVEDSRLWKGRLASSPPNLKYFVQAASGVGLVALEDNRGAYFGVSGAPPAPTTFALDPLPPSATFGQPIAISGTLTAGGVPVAGKLVTIRVGATTQIGMTDATGRVTVQVPGVAVTGTFQVSAAFAGDEGASSSSSSAPLVVDKADSTLTPLQTPGVTLSGVLGETATPLQGESVAFSVDGPGGARTIFAITDYVGEATLPPPTALDAGTYTVSQASYEGNAKYANTSVALTQQFVVPKSPQGITFEALGDKTFGDADFAVFASASSMLTVSFAASGNCTIAASIVHLTGSGSCTITASQPGNANYEPAAPVSRTFAIATNGKADQVIAFGAAPSNVHVGDVGIAVSATSTSPTAPPSGIPITFDSLSQSVCTVGASSGALTFVAAGSCTIVADQAGDASYNPAPQATLVFTVLPAGGGNVGAFAATGAMAAGRSDHTATLLEDGRVLVAGGFAAGGAVLGSAELYCPDNASAPPDFVVCPAPQRGTFVATTPLAVPAAGQTATRLHDGTVLLIGGANSSLQWFTPATQSWSSLTNALADRTFHTATLLANGKVFVAGGVNGAGQTLASTFIVDTSTQPFTIAQGPDLNFARESHTATLLPDDTVLIAGGRRALAVDFALVGQYELYDPSVAGPRGNGDIGNEAAMSRARFWHAAEIAGVAVVVAGGSCDTASAVSSALRSTELFSFATGAEPSVACNAAAGPSDLLQARRALTLTALPDGSLLAVGGANGSGAPLASSERFDASAKTFAAGPALVTARSEHQATSLLDGRVLVTGGVDANGTPLASAEIFGGAGGAGGASNQRPIANAGPDQSVMAGATVQLTGAGSSDPEGRPLEFFWTFTSKPAGSAALLANANAVNPTFVADVQGVYIVQLIVNDGGTPPLDSAADSITVTAGNRAPVANGDAYSVAQDATLTVDTASGVLANDTDADGDPLTAALNVNVAHGTLTLNGDGSFTYAPAAGYSGPDSFTYHANDAKADSNVATVSLTVTPITPVNHPPVANAGSDQSVTAGQLVQLAGGCTDADNDTTTLAWSLTRPATSAATLSSTTIANPKFTADVAGTYQAQLICNDGKIDSAPATVTVTASAVTATLTIDNTGLVGIGRADSFGITLSAPAPAGGLVVTLTSDNAGVYAITTPTVTVPAGETQATGSGSGVGNGTTTLRASAPGYTPGALNQTVTENIAIVIGPVNVPLGATAPITIAVIPQAPVGGVVLTLSSDAPAIATTTSSTITIAAGQTSATASVSGLATGTANISASASGYAGVSGIVNTIGASAPVQWTVASGGNGHWYQFVFSQSGSTWDAARIAANDATFLGMPGYLATITSQGENDFLFALAKYPAGATGTLFDPANPNVSLGPTSIAGRDALAWLGGSDLGGEGVWRWIAGPESGSIFWNGNGTGSAPPGEFAFWGTGQPDDFNSNEDFLQFRYSGGRWNDAPTLAIQNLEGTNPDGTATRGPVGYIVEYSPPAAPVTTYTVTNLNDSGAGSLRDAIVEANQAPGPAMVVFAAGLTGTITLSSQIQISGPVTIVGPGADKVTIDASSETGSTGRVFSIFATDPICPAIDGPDYLVSISGLTLANALNTFANTGGAIFTEHSLALDSMVIRDSVARQGAGVGMQVQYPGQALTIANSQFLGNFARPIAVTGTTTLSNQQGAGVFVAERCSGTRVEPVTVSISSSTLSGNRAQPTTLVGRGGAISVFSHADTTIVDTRVVDNHVDVPDPPVAGLNYRGAGFYGTGKSLRIERSEISDNTIVDVTASDQTRGGAIALFNDPADLQAPASAMDVKIVNSTISGNAVPATAGALWIFGNVALEIDNSTIANNDAGAGRTGGILITTGATTPAGPANAAAPTLTLVSSILRSNPAAATDISTNTANIPSFTVNATNSLIGSICSTCNITLAGSNPLDPATDPMLGPLADNGGPTRTHALLAGSQAIDAGSNPLNLATDQRGAGFPRVSNAAADIGAFEQSNQLIVSLTSPLVGVGRTINGTITLPQDAPAGGSLVTIASSNTSLATVAPSSVTIAAGNRTASFSVNGVAVGGPITISASAPGFSGGATTVTVTNALVSLGSLPTIGLGQSVSLPVSLTAPAPAGGLTVNFTSDDPSIVTITPSVFIAAGQTIPAANPQVTGVNIGTTKVNASAAGFAPDSRTANVQVSVTFTPTTLTVVQSANKDITVDISAPAPTGGLAVTLATANPAIATVVSPVTVPEGQLSVAAAVTGVAVGSTTLQATGTGITSGSATINVTNAPALTIGDQTIGKDLQVQPGLSLGAPAPAGGLLVTLTSSDASKLLLSTNAATAGSASVQVTIPAGQSFNNTFFLQALTNTGTATLTASAPGYATDTSTITFGTSGFYNSSPGSDFTTTTFSANTVFRVQATQLTAAGAPQRNQAVRGGATVNVPVTVADVTGTNVGAITISPVVFNGGDSSKDTAFDPISAGTAQITIGVPSGFATPSTNRVITATVNPPGISIGDQTIGKDLQVQPGLSLAASAPAGGLLVTLTSSDASKLLLSTSGTTAGSASIQVTVPAGQSFNNTFFLQALTNTGTATVMTSAPGYATDTSTVTFTPSGFYNSSPGGDFTTTTFSTNTLFRVQAAQLTAAGARQRNQAVRGGLTVNVPVTVADVTGTNVGAITVSPVVFSGGDSSKDTAFDPNSAGTAQITIGVPVGFATPSTEHVVTATVTAPSLALGDQTIGKDLQVQTGLSLGAPAPAGGVLVTLTSSDASKLLLSTNAAAAGSASIQVTVPAGQTSSSVFLQALTNTGTATVTVSAPGYATDTSTITFAPSGFYNSSPGGDFTTTTFSANTLFRVQAAQLTAAGAFQRNQAVRGGLTVNVPVTVADVTGTNVGAITASPVTFGGGDSFKDTAFDPVSAGTAQITIGVPAGFATPSTNRVITATVTAPPINSGNVLVGRDLQTSVSITLGATPPSPVTVTVTVASGTIGRVSSSATTLGGTTLSFPNVTTANVGTMIVQGLALGSTQITVQAPGYSDDTSTLTVQPSGFANTSPGGNFATTTLSNDTVFRVQPVRLDPTTFNVLAFQAVRGGASVSVPVTSSNTGVGTITVSPITFNGGDGFVDTGFHPLSTGSTVLTVGVPPGFSTPATSQQITATVTQPAIVLGNQVVGKDLQVQPSLSLGAPAPAGGLVVTLTSSDPSVRLSTDAASAGTSSIQVTVAAGASFTNAFFIQVLAGSGSATITATASGFATDMGTITMVPSGFVSTSPGSNFSTSVGAANTLIRIQSARLDPTTLNVVSFQEPRGGIAPVSVPVTSDAPGVGVITTSPVTFGGGDNFKDTAFDPVGTGTATITVGVPAGFSTPSNSRIFTATVN